MQPVSLGEFIFIASGLMSIFIIPAIMVWRYESRGKQSRRTTTRAVDKGRGYVKNEYADPSSQYRNGGGY